MFCRQCEQTAGGKGCTVQGVCGKSPETAVLIDALIHGLKGIAVYANKARELGAADQSVDRFVIEGLFTTVTNVNFDAAKMETLVRESQQVKEKAAALFLDAYRKKNGAAFTGALPAVTGWQPAASTADLLVQAAALSPLMIPAADEDIRSVRELILYGLKGMAAYADHARVLGETDETVNAFFHTALSALADDTLTLNDYVALTMELGKVNLACMETLDKANNKCAGAPSPANVELGVKKGPAILVSGHDLLDLRQLLEQTAGKGVNVYTHGEMLPAHGYPELRAFPHLAGHYGSAWQNQQTEFAAFPGTILMTTNCIQKPREAYGANIFTTGLVQWPGVEHISADANGRKDFTKLIEKAKTLGGFKEDVPGKRIMTGFAHDAVMKAAGTVIEAVKSGALKHIFLIGGCDGAKPGRSYYREFAEKTPKDTLILTLACGKFRFNTVDFGTVAGLPRLLDMGQCNDAYSAIKVASALAGAFNTTVNGLPLSLILSWYEQKAVCILITLLSLGIKNIRLGPTLPAFISPNILKFLVEQFNIKPVTTPDQDIKECLAR
jgi:hydroxylamine reductase